VQIDDVAGTTDPALRNLRITQTYHDLGCRVAARGLQADATWLFFAVWASKTAGGIIRGEELPACLRDHLDANEKLAETRERVNRRWRFFRWLGVPGCLEHSHLLRVGLDVADEVSAQIAAGNLSVFEELAPRFAQLTVEPQAGVPTESFSPVDAAMDAYRQALSEPDAEKRAILVLGANTTAVAHEQQRLQDKIEAALDAPIVDGLKSLIDTEVSRWVPGKAFHAAAGKAVAELCTELELVWRRAVTVTMMRLVTADEHLDLHDTVPALPGQPLFPGPLAGGDAGAAVAAWDLTAGEGHPCGASDWSAMRERMNYIVNFFRSRQRHPGLSSSPFSADQVAAIEAGQIPPGPL